MSKSYKNFWSLNTDESVVAGILRDETKHEVLMPLNAQMKDIDLVLADIESKRYYTVQVKGSRAYEPKKREVDKYGAGSAGWFFFSKDIIERSRVDYFIFLVYVIEESEKTGRRHFSPHTVTIPTSKLKELVLKYKLTHGDNRYSFLIWINPKTQKAFDFRDTVCDLSDFLDQKGFSKLNNQRL